MRDFEIQVVGFNHESLIAMFEGIGDLCKQRANFLRWAEKNNKPMIEQYQVSVTWLKEIEALSTINNFNLLSLLKQQN